MAMLALQSGPGWPSPIQTFGWVGHNAFGPNNNRCQQMSDFKAKVNQIPLGELIQRSPYLLAGSKGPIATSKGTEGTGGEENAK